MSCSGAPRPARRWRSSGTGGAWIVAAFFAATTAAVVPARPVAAQDAYTYLVRPEPIAEHEALETRPPLRVIHGPEVTWLLADGRSATLESARLLLHGNAPVTHGPGSLLVRGWPESASDGPDSVSFELVRGDQDREVAGRMAIHYYLLARVIRREWVPAAVDGLERHPERRYRVTAELWLIPGLPFTWAPFASRPESLPALLPGLRDDVEKRLEDLGMVARAVTRISLEPSGDNGGHPGDERLSGFEVSNIQPTRALPAPGPIVERATADALVRLLRDHRRTVCASASHGDLPAVMESRVPPESRPALLGYARSRCPSG